MSSVLRYIKWHYSDVTLRRSEKQIEREKKFLGCMPFNRWMTVPAAVLVQLCIGSLYSWSIFNVPIEEELGLASGTAANTFYIAVGFFGFSAAVFGPILERHGPRIILCLSSTLMFIGYMIAAIGAWQKIMGLIYFGYGVISGIGLGISYITPVSPLQKWFPDYKGLLSGLAVCGFGGGSMIASKVESVCISQYGVAKTFVILGVSYYIVMMACTLVLRCPPPGYYVESPEERKRRRDHERFLQEYGASRTLGAMPSTSLAASSVAPFPRATSVADETKKSEIGFGAPGAVPESSVLNVSQSQMPQSVDAVALREPELKFTLLEALFSWDYFCMYITLMGNSCAGLMILSKMSDIMQQQFGQSKTFGANIVLINSGFNLLGRLVYGAISDKTGQKPIFVVSMFVQAIIMGVLPTLMHEGSMWFFISLIWILATFYGGGFGLMPAFLTAQFGSSNIGALHGIVLTGWSLIGVIGGLTFTAIFKNQVHKYADEGGKKSPYVYDINFYTICAFIVICWFVVIQIRTDTRDRLMPRKKGEIIRIPFFGRPIVFGYKTKEDQNDEWFKYLRSLPINQPGANGNLGQDSVTVDRSEEEA